MPVQWTISKPHRLVIAVARDELRLKDVTTYLDGLAIADVLSYRKIFDMTHATVLFSQEVRPRTMKATDPRLSARNVLRFRVVSPDDPAEVNAACKCLAREGRAQSAGANFLRGGGELPVDGGHGDGDLRPDAVLRRLPLHLHVDGEG